MLLLSAPFWFTFIIVLSIVFMINYVSQTYLMKKKDHKINRKSITILSIQSLAIALLLTFVV